MQFRRIRSRFFVLSEMIHDEICSFRSITERPSEIHLLEMAIPLLFKIFFLDDIEVEQV